MIHFIQRKLRLDGVVSRFLLWIIIIVFLTSSSYLITYSIVDRKVKLQEAEESLHYGLSNQMIALENWSADRIEELNLLASFPVTKNTDYEVMAARFNYFGHYYEQLNAIVYIDQDGYVRLDTGLEDVIIEDLTINVADRAYFKAVKNGEPIAFNIIEKESTGDEAVLFSTPVLNDEGEFNGALVTVVHLDKITQLLSETIQGETGKITFATADGELILQVTKDGSETFVASNEKERLNADLYHYIEKVAGQDFFEYKTESENAIYSTFSPLLNDQFLLINEIDRREIRASHNRIVMLMLSVTVVIVVVAIFLLYPLLRRLLRPFNHLVVAISDMKAGRYDTQIDLEHFKTSPRELRQIMYVFNEMAESIHANKKVLKQLSTTDSLTNIANRRLFEIHLTDQWDNCLHAERPLSLLFIDIDYFKKYNDSFGHQEGDQCLIAISQALKKVITKPNQLVARYGGEEFVITLPNVSQEEAYKRAVQVQEEISKLRIRRSPHDEQKYVTVSIGVATLVPTTELNKEIIIQKADQALYEAKSQGRNKVVVKEMPS